MNAVTQKKQQNDVPSSWLAISEAVQQNEINILTRIVANLEVQFALLLAISSCFRFCVLFLLLRLSLFSCQLGFLLMPFHWV